MGDISIKITSTSDLPMPVQTPGGRATIAIEIEADPPFPVVQGQLDYKNMTNEQGAAFLMISSVVGEESAVQIIESGIE